MLRGVDDVRPTIRKIRFGGAALLAVITVAMVQPSYATGGVWGANTPLYDPGQMPAFKGRMQQFTLTPRGDIDGLILADGTEVKTPPHLSTQLAYVLRVGDPVTVHGLKA